MNTVARENVPMDRNLAIVQLWNKAGDARSRLEVIEEWIANAKKTIKPVSSVIRDEDKALSVSSPLIYSEAANHMDLNVAGINHSDLSNLLENVHTQYVNAVSDTASLNLTLTGQSISGVVLTAGVDHGGLSGLGDDDHTQYVLVAGIRAMTDALTVAKTVDNANFSALILKNTDETADSEVGQSVSIDAYLRQSKDTVQSDELMGRIVFGKTDDFFNGPPTELANDSNMQFWVDANGTLTKAMTLDYDLSMTVVGIINATGGNSTNWNAASAASHARAHNLLTVADHTDVATYLDQALLVASAPQFTRLGIGAAADATIPLHIEKNPAGGTYDATTIAAVFGYQAGIDSLFLTGASINGALGSDTDDDLLRLNYRGYLGGITRYRSMILYNGKGASIMTAVGSTKAVTFSGALNVTGTTTLTTSLNGLALLTAGVISASTLLGWTALTDPNADRIAFWDDSESAMKWLTVSTGLDITAATLTCTITQYTDALARAAISETVTGLDYNNTTGVISLTTGYVIPTTTQETNWGTAYTKSHDRAHNLLTAADHADVATYLDQALLTTSTPQFDRLGIGVAADATVLLSIAKAAAVNGVYLSCYSDTLTDYSNIYFRRSNSDTLGTIAQTLDTQYIGGLWFQGVKTTGPAFTAGAKVLAISVGDAGANYAGVKLIFQTATNAAAIATRLSIMDTGQIIAGDPDTADTVPLVRIWGGTAGVVDSAADSILTLEDSGDVYLSFLRPGANKAGIYFGVFGANNQDYIIYNPATSSMSVGLGNIDALKFTLHGSQADAVFSGDISIKTYAQDAEPTLSNTGALAIWKDTNDSDRIWLIYKRGTADQRRIELV